MKVATMGVFTKLFRLGIIALVMILPACSSAIVTVSPTPTASLPAPTATLIVPVITATPIPTGRFSFSGKVILTAPVAGAVITLYTWENNGALLPVPLAQPVMTGPDGSYRITHLPSSLDDKTLVVQARGGIFTDVTTGKTYSFENRTLHLAIPAIDFNRPLGGVLTPFTDVAFYLAQHDLATNPKIFSSANAAYGRNLQISAGFGLGEEEGRYSIDPAIVGPSYFGRGKQYDSEYPPDSYALALAAISQLASLRRISPIDLVDQFSADATDDGVLNGAALSISGSLPEAKELVLYPNGKDDAPDYMGLAFLNETMYNFKQYYYLRPAGDQDWFCYRFWKGGSKIQFNLDQLPANYDLYVYYSRGLVASSTNAGVAAENVEIVWMGSRPYCVQIIGANGEWDANHSYQLWVRLFP